MIKIRVWNYWSNNDVNYDDIKEIRCCLNDPFNHFEIEDKEDWPSGLGNHIEGLLQEIHDQTEDQSTTPARMNQLISEGLARYAQTPNGFFSTISNDSIMVMAKVTDDIESEGEHPCIKVIWAHPSVKDFAESLQLNSEECIELIFNK